MKKAWAHTKRKINKFWVETFWQYPNRLFALKKASVVAAILIPFELIGQPVIGSGLALGAVTIAISETYDYPKGRIKTLLLLLLSFFITSSSVVLLRPYPILFGIGLVFSTFFFIIVGGLGERYRGITFGGLLVGIYTMLSSYNGHPWYFQPLLFTIGGFIYGIISLGFLYARPWRILKEQLALGFRKLGEYSQAKAKFFPSKPEEQDYLVSELAKKNIAVVDSIKRIQTALSCYATEAQKKPKLAIYYQKWILLQQLHERIASSHDRYDILSTESKNPTLIEGFGRLLTEIAEALNKVSNAFLTDATYKHPISLSWTIAALKEMIDKYDNDPNYTQFTLLLENLSELEQSLSSIEDYKGIYKMPEINEYEDSLKTRFKSLFNKNSSRFRYAVRLCICFIFGYMLINFMNIEKGEWILMTSLFVCQQTYVATRRRLFHRIIGTIIGVIISITATRLLPTDMGQIILIIACIYTFTYWIEKKYAVAVIFITTYVLATFNIQDDSSYAIMGPRILDTTIGSFIAFIVVRFVWPNWQYKQLPTLINTALIQNKKYLQAIYTPEFGPFDYNECRKAAHEADTALTSAWKGIKVEPKKDPFYERMAFSLTHSNHTLLSYISALGAYNQNEILDEYETEICKKIENAIHEVQKLHSSNSIDNKLELTIKEINKLENTLKDERSTSKNDRIVLLYNMVRTTNKLLMEALELHEHIVTKK